MKLIVISPESEDPREPALLAALFAAGLTDYHLRKPTWTRAQLAAFLRALPSAYHPRILLHTHHDLASDFALRGLHHRDDSEGRAGPLGPPRTPPSPAPAPHAHEPPRQKCDPIGYTFRSRAIHNLAALHASLDTPGRLLVSPIFPSLSKPGHGPSSAFSLADLRTALALPRRAEVIALGGIDASRLPACRALGFDGVAVLGAVWQSPDPVHAFAELQAASRLSPVASRLPSHAA